MTSRTVSLLVAGALVGGAAVPAQGASIPKTNNCGTIATANGGKAKYIRSFKVKCTTAKTVARKARGKAYKASGFACRVVGPTYLCSKAGTKQTVVFTYKKPGKRA